MVLTEILREPAVQAPKLFVERELRQKSLHVELCVAKVVQFDNLGPQEVNHRLDLSFFLHLSEALFETCLKVTNLSSLDKCCLMLALSPFQFDSVALRCAVLAKVVFDASYRDH